MFSIADLLWLTLLFAMLAGITWGMFYLQDIVVQSAAIDDRQEEWDQWREAVRAGKENAGPVRRRVPKSSEPPALVLLRDHFATCLGVALVLSSVLFGAFVLFARGVMNSPQVSPRRDEQNSNPF